jgi:exosortase/archaeosortase family protein
MSRPKKEQQGLSLKSLREEWVKWYAGKGPVLMFALKFAGLIFLFYLVSTTIVFDRTLYSYLKANAWLANVILNILGQHSHVADVTITTPSFTMGIRRGCDAVEPTWLLCAVILAFPAALTRKLWGILVGIVMLQLLNLVRIVTLYWIGVHWPSAFNSAHLEIWPVVFIIVALLLFVGWKTWLAPSPKAHAT